MTVSKLGMGAESGSERTNVERKFCHGRKTARQLAIRTPRQPARVQQLRPAGGGARRWCACAARPTSSASSTTRSSAAAPKFVLGGGSNLVLTRDVAARGAEGRDPGPPAGARDARRLDRRGRRRRELARLRRLDAAAGLAGAGEPGADPRLGGRGAGAEHRCLRRRAEGPLRLARRRWTWSPAAASRWTRRNAPSATATACSSSLLAGKTLITRVRFRLPRPWQPVLGYLELERRDARDRQSRSPMRSTVFDWVCAIRRAKLPDPAADRQCRQLLQEPGGQRRAVPRHHRPRPRDRALPAARRQRQAGRRLADRRLRLEGQVASAAPASTSARRWCWSTAAAPSAPRC